MTRPSWGVHQSGAASLIGFDCANQPSQTVNNFPPRREGPRPRVSQSVQSVSQSVDVRVGRLRSRAILRTTFPLSLAGDQATGPGGSPPGHEPHDLSWVKVSGNPTGPPVSLSSADAVSLRLGGEGWAWGLGMVLKGTVYGAAHKSVWSDNVEQTSASGSEGAIVQIKGSTSRTYCTLLPVVDRVWGGRW